MPCGILPGGSGETRATCPRRCRRARASDLQTALVPSELGSKSPRAAGHYGRYEFHLVAQKLQTFCSEDLGGFYLDILKDRLYTAGTDSRARRSAQNALYHMTQALVRLMAPVLSFTAQATGSPPQPKATPHRRRVS